MRKILFMITLVVMLQAGIFAFGECPPGSNWVRSWTDDWGNSTYTLEAPCKVYIGIPFNIKATVTDEYCANNWMASFWAIVDNGTVIDGCVGCQNSIWTVNGQWQRVIERTYTGTPVDHTIEFRFTDHGLCSGFHQAESSLIGSITVDPYPSAPSLSCVGFEPPLDKSPVKFRRNRVLPLKAQLLKADGGQVTGLDIKALPVVQVLYNSATGGTPVDVSENILSAGQGTDGNQFIFTEEGKWQFNLKTGNYTAQGTYSVSIQTGDDSEYVVDPACSVYFLVE